MDFAKISQEGSISRRTLLRRGAFAGLGAVLAPLALQGCGTSDSPASPTASGDTLSRLQSSKYARLSSYQQPPHGWFDASDGKWKGVDVDIIEYILPKLGVESWDYVTADWNAMIPGLQASRWDLMSIGMGYTKTRSEQVSFSSPAYQYGEAMMVQSGNPKNIHGTADWAGKRIGGILGSVDDQLVGGVAGATYVPYQKYADMYRDLASGRIDAGLVDELQVEYDLKLSPMPEIAVDHAWTGKSTYLTGIVMRKSDSALSAQVDAIIEAMKNDGTMLRILKTYGLTEANMAACNTVTKFDDTGVAVC